MRSFRRRILHWFNHHARDLPWRRTCDPYCVWLSEMMLQQTQVATVIPYYERFLAAFPNVVALAAAPEEQVLRLWEGLGYYRRARQLHCAAGVIVAKHAGVFPRRLEDVRALPGVGRYTAGAIVSIAFDAPAPILEANTTRLLSRLWAYRGDPSSRAAQELLWRAAEMLLPRHGAGRLNQALMELGSQVCIPREPRCDACPVADLCPTRALGLQHAIPRKRAKPLATAVRQAALVVRRGDEVLLVRGDGRGRYGGLWDFPRFDVEGEHSAQVLRELAAKLLALTGTVAVIGRRFCTLKHTVTRFRITLDCYEAAPRDDARPIASTECRWWRLDQLSELPLNATGRKLCGILTDS